MKRKKILVCVLNWGLGHATRCIPVVRELQRQGAEVQLASDGRALHLLRKEFPALTAHELPAYNITYRTDNFFLNILPQLCKIYFAALREKKAVKELHRREQFDGIISDNRLGCRVENVPSVMMTHQLRLKVPVPFLEDAAAFFNKNYLKNFDTIWVPDRPGASNLAGDLAHADSALHPTFIGVLSRMQMMNIPQKYDAAVILSGPEPQRTYLEKKIIEQATAADFKVIIVQGKTENYVRRHLSPQVEVVSFMTTEELNRTMSAAGIIIARSGYSTLMDLVKLRKKAVLIPTPGQTEQEYLAEELCGKGIFYTVQQQKFDLEKAMREGEKFSGFSPVKEEKDLLAEAVKKFVYGRQSSQQLYLQGDSKSPFE